MRAYNGRTTSKGTTPPRPWRSAQLRAWHLQVLRSPQARSAHRTASLLMHRAAKHGANVYGSQQNIADELHQVERTIRYHLAILESLGLISVRRCRPERGPDGRWSRRYSNAYVLTFPNVSSVSPGRTYRQRIASHAPTGHSQPSPAAFAGPACVQPHDEAPPEVARAALMAARQALRNAFVPPAE